MNVLSDCINVCKRRNHLLKRYSFLFQFKLIINDEKVMMSCTLNYIIEKNHLKRDISAVQLFEFDRI